MTYLIKNFSQNVDYMLKTINTFTFGCDHKFCCLPSTATFSPAKLTLDPIRALLLSVQYLLSLVFRILQALLCKKKQLHVGQYEV